MFIVKAEVRKESGVSYQMFETQSVRVGRPEYVPGEVRPLPDADIAVSLCDIDGSTSKVLEVGHSAWHYSAVYVMNERGKTVDSVYPLPAPNAQGCTQAA